MEVLHTLWSQNSVSRKVLPVLWNQADLNQMGHTSAHNRYQELDACRGIAIGMMVFFHFLFDLSFFSLFRVDVQHGPWRIFGYCTAFLFICIAGIAVAIRGQRSYCSMDSFRWYYQFLARGLFIIGMGFLVTAGTYLFLQGDGYVLFGILHLIGLSTILAPFFFRLREMAVIPGVLIILAGYVTLPYGPLCLLFLGIHPPAYYSIDYTPLIPWFGVFLIGLGLGFFLYPQGLRRWRIPEHVLPGISLVAFLGRHSLGIYLIHQPVLIGILCILSGRLLGW